MKLSEFEKYMEDNFGAFWTSFWIAPINTIEQTRLEGPEQMNNEIVQLDYIGLSVGTESLMINLTVWVDEMPDPIKITSKMLGSNLNKCFFAMREIMRCIKTSYYSVNSNM